MVDQIVEVSPFVQFRDTLDKHIREMAKTGLFRVQTEKNELWDLYLASFPEGSNPIYRERTQHDCQCCKKFIRDIGDAVTINDGKIISIWDAPGVQEPYATVATALSTLVHSKSVESHYLHYECRVGVPHNHEQLNDGTVHTWEHFHHELDQQYVVSKQERPTILGRRNTLTQLIHRSLETISVEAAETVLDLIKQNSLYRGAEHKKAVEAFLSAKRLYDTLPEAEKSMFVWSEAPKSAAIRNSVIGTLLVALSEGEELDRAVAAFEAKVAPANYKRATALVTPGMIRKAEEKVAELGLMDALARRHAKVDDLTINSILFADRSVKKELSVFDELAMQAKQTSPGSLSKIEEVSAQHFVEEILPSASSIEVQMENSHVSNLMSLLTPEYPDAPTLFSWGNNFSWAYNGDVTDSIKERVKAAGGTVTGLMRASLAWWNYDDLDIHC